MAGAAVAAGAAGLVCAEATPAVRVRAARLAASTRNFIHNLIQSMGRTGAAPGNRHWPEASSTPVEPLRHDTLGYRPPCLTATEASASDRRRRWKFPLSLSFTPREAACPTPC